MSVCGIDGVILTPLKQIDGPQGAVLHALTKSAPGFAGFGEAYFSEIHDGAIKSWRRHLCNTLNLIVVAGSVDFVVHDRGVFVRHRLGRAAHHYARLTVPPKLWLAFRGVGPGSSLILDITDGEHDPAKIERRELAEIPYDWGP